MSEVVIDVPENPPRKHLLDFPTQTRTLMYFYDIAFAEA
jgi:hypothetical protein